MKIARNKPTLIAFGFTVIAVASSPAQAASLYSITELPFLPTDLNDRDQIVGESYLWNNGSVTDLRSLPGATDGIRATAINNQGTIVGEGLKDTLNNSTRPFLSDGTKVSALGSPSFCPTSSSCYSSFASDINEIGQVAVNVSFGERASSYVQNPDGSQTSISSADAGITASAEDMLV